MISKHYGKNFTIQRLREISGINREGVSLLGISEAAEKIGFRTTGCKLSLKQLKEIDLPAILHWGQNHFVVLYKAPKTTQKESIWHIADLGKGLIKYNEQEFIKKWLNINHAEMGIGIALILSPTPAFYPQEGDKETGLN